MRLKSRLNIKSTLDLTPMIDIVFLLVIFFMVSTVFILNPGLKINLPEAQSSDAQPEKDIVISITRSGTVFLNENVVDIKEITSRVRSIAEDSNKDMVIIKGDGDIKYELLIKVMDKVRMAGINKINLATKKK